MTGADTIFMVLLLVCLFALTILLCGGTAWLLKKMFKR